MRNVTDEERSYWETLRRYGYSYEDIARKSFERFGLKRHKSTVFKHARHIDQVLEDGADQWTLPKLTISKRTKLRAAGLVERFDMELDDIVEQGLDLFEVKKDNEMETQDLLAVRDFLEKMRKKRRSPSIVVWVLLLLDELEESGIDINDVHEVKRILEGVLSSGLDESVAASLPEILMALGRIRMEANWLLWLLNAVSEMGECGMFEDATLLLLKQLDMEERSGKPSEEAWNQVMDRIDTKLDLEDGIRSAEEELKSLRRDIQALSGMRSSKEFDHQLRLKEMAHELRSLEDQILRNRGVLESLAEEVRRSVDQLNATKEQVKEADSALRDVVRQSEIVIREYEDKKKWLQENAETVDTSRGFLCLVASYPLKDRVALMIYAQQVIGACAESFDARTRGEIINTNTRAFQRKIFCLLGESTGFFKELTREKRQHEITRTILKTYQGMVSSRGHQGVRKGLR
ncbi:MAG: hypothetical protein ACE5QF_06185 [Thermoplasmata archaeon]